MQQYYSSWRNEVSVNTRQVIFTLQKSDRLKRGVHIELKREIQEAGEAGVRPMK